VKKGDWKAKEVILQASHKKVWWHADYQIRTRAAVGRRRRDNSLLS
jgi:hypothetical protein